MKTYMTLIAAMGLALGSTAALAATEQGMIEEDSAFRAADEDSDGQIDRDEYFDQAFRTETQLSDQWFTAADENDDGTLDVEEHATAESLGLNAFGVGG